MLGAPTFCSYAHTHAVAKDRAYDNAEPEEHKYYQFEHFLFFVINRQIDIRIVGFIVSHETNGGVPLCAVYWDYFPEFRDERSAITALFWVIFEPRRQFILGSHVIWPTELSVSHPLNSDPIHILDLSAFYCGYHRQKTCFIRDERQSLIGAQSTGVLGLCKGILAIDHFVFHLCVGGRYRRQNADKNSGKHNTLKN